MAQRPASVTPRRRPAIAVLSALVPALLSASCAADPDDAARTGTVTTGPTATTATNATNATAATAPTATTGTEAAPGPPSTVPAGVLAAVPFQNRLDVAKGVFQVKLYNGTDDPLDVVSVQLVWDGLTTPVSARANMLVAGDRLDYTVALAPARCAGDGTAATMPNLDTAVVRVGLRDGRTVEAAVHDVKGFAEKLYLEDCERQHVEAATGLTWDDLHERAVDGRPVTEGVLRVSRRDARGRVTVLFVGNTINFTVLPLTAGDVVADLPADADEVEVPVRFIEGRCDAHARSESSQPFNFVAVVDLGDGIERSVSVVPSQDDQLAMRRRVEEACTILGRTGFAGQASSTSTGT